jgi:hypothetical protein
MNQPLRLRPNRRLAPTAAVLGLLALALAAPVARAQTVLFEQDKSASAIFESVDPTGCFVTDAIIKEALI